MNGLTETPFKLTKEEILASAASTLCLFRLEKFGTPAESLANVALPPQYGYTASASTQPCGPRFVRITDIRGGTVDWNRVPFCQCPKPGPYQLASGDILIARSGSVGKSFLVSNVPEVAVFASYMIRLRSKPETNRRYLYWCLQSQQFWQQVMGARRGSAMKNINGKMLASLRFPWPDVPLQKATVQFLDAFRQRLSGNKVELPELPEPLSSVRGTVSRIEELAAKVGEVHELRRAAAIEADAVTNSALAKIVATLKERVGCKRLGEVIKEAGYGTSRKCDLNRLKDSVPVLRIPNVASERVNLENLKYTHLTQAEMERVLLAPGDVLVVRTNGSIDLVGRSAVVPNLTEKTAFASYLIRIRCNADVIWSPYFQIMLKHLRTNGNLIDFARTTAGQYNVSLGRLRAAELPVPSLDDQQDVVAYLNDLQAKVEGLKNVQSETAAELDALMPSILAKAFRGEF